MENITDLSAQLYVQLQRLAGAISLYRSFYTMAGFIPKTHYRASHVDKKQEFYSAEQWLSDFFANKTGLIPSFLDMNQCVPPSPDAAAKMLSSFLEGLDALPMLTAKDDSGELTLIEALRIDILVADKSRKLRGTSPIYLTDTQKGLALNMVDEIDVCFTQAIESMKALRAAYQSEVK